MFERYSEKARRVIFFARYEASQLGIPNIGTEHLLLGMLREAADLLTSIAGLDAIETIRNLVRQEYPPKDKIPTSVDMPFSEAAKRVLIYAADEADQLESRAITPKQIMIGLLREDNCTAQRILSQLGVTTEAVRHYQERFADLQDQDEKHGLRVYEGVLEVLPEGYGLLRSRDCNYLPGPNDIYISPSQIRRCHLHTGDIISGQIRMPTKGERYRALVQVDAVNYEPPK